jgi:hypothetical protein
MGNPKRKTLKQTARDRRGTSTKRSHRNPGQSILRTASAEDAPIEAWQQAMLPHLHKLADIHGLEGTSECAFVFLCLLRLKPFEKIGEFKDWVHRVTGYPCYEIKEFVNRAMESFLIVDGRSNAEAFESAVTHDDEESYVSVMLLTKVLEGKFRRHADSTYSLSSKTAT